MKGNYLDYSIETITPCHISFEVLQVSEEGKQLMGHIIYKWESS